MDLKGDMKTNNQLLLENLSYLEEIFKKYKISEDLQQDTYLAFLQGDNERYNQFTDKQLRGFLHNMIKYKNWNSRKLQKVIFDTELYETEIKKLEFGS